MNYYKQNNLFVFKKVIAVFFFLHEWNHLNFLTAICLKSKYLSVILSYCVDDNIILTLALCGFDVGF